MLRRSWIDTSGIGTATTTSNVVRGVLEDGDTSVMEITMKFPDGAEAGAVVVTRWIGELMMSYRLYMDRR